MTDMYLPYNDQKSSGSCHLFMIESRLLKSQTDLVSRGTGDLLETKPEVTAENFIEE